MSSVLICTKDVASLKFLYSVCSRLYSVCIICDVKGVVSSFVLYSVCIRLYSFVLRLYPVCTARDVSSLGFLYSFCIPLYSCVLRLYSFVPLGMSFPLSFCIPFVPVCTLTPFGEYNTIRRREEYKSTKACKCAPSIVLGARWPNGITTTRAVAAAPVALCLNLFTKDVMCPKF